MTLLKKSDPNRYETLLIDLANQFSRKTDQYSEDLTDACNLLVNYKNSDQLKWHRRRLRDCNVINRESAIDVNDGGEDTILA